LLAALTYAIDDFRGEILAAFAPTLI